jgi:hypothetical protein
MTHSSGDFAAQLTRIVEGHDFSYFQLENLGTAQASQLWFAFCHAFKPGQSIKVAIDAFATLTK